MEIILLASCLVLGCSALSARQDRRFPDDFLFGAATAAYQIEGGWDADGKGENIWDNMFHNDPTTSADLNNGDIAADSYNNYKRDVEMIRELGLDAYRFSISWARILPTGFSNEINEAGVDFYNNYINEMLKYNITPMATLYHFDLPQKLQELGGLTNPLISDWFEDYARVAYTLFGDRVKYWITLNEPSEICYFGYTGADSPPRINMTGIADYICSKNLIKAHAQAYHAYNNDFKAAQGGECGITVSVIWYEPATDSEEDALAAELKRQSDWGMFIEPIFSEKGGLPKELLERVAEKSAEQGYARSRLLDFTDEEKAFIQGSADFFGMNHYTTNLVSATENIEYYNTPSIFDDIGVGTYVPDDWPNAASSWLYLAPNSIYNAMSYLSEKYNNPVIYITENGWSTKTGLIDDDRVTYYRAIWENMLDVLEAGINLKGYMAWSLMDNLEWTAGYTSRFGLYEVDFEDSARTRTPRKSAFVYKQLIKTRVIEHNYEPDPETLTMTIDEGH